MKVQASLHSSGGGREHSRIITHREHRSYAPHSRNHAVKTTHSRLISHFSPELFSVDGHTSLGVYGSGAVSRSAAAHRTATRHTPRKHTTDELLEFAVQHAPHAPKQHAVRHRRRIIRHPHARQHA
jgi:hypothetical protein